MSARGCRMSHGVSGELTGAAAGEWRAGCTVCSLAQQHVLRALKREIWTTTHLRPPGSACAGAPFLHGLQNSGVAAQRCGAAGPLGRKSRHHWGRCDPPDPSGGVGPPVGVGGNPTGGRGNPTWGPRRAQWGCRKVPLATGESPLEADAVSHSHLPYTQWVPLGPPLSEGGSNSPHPTGECSPPVRFPTWGASNRLGDSQFGSLTSAPR